MVTLHIVSCLQVKDGHKMVLTLLAGRDVENAAGEAGSGAEALVILLGVIEEPSLAPVPSQLYPSGLHVTEVRKTD